MPHMLSRKVAGSPFTLKAGQHYIASRSPVAEGAESYSVCIRETGFVSGPFGTPLAMVEGLTGDGADELVAAFNAGSDGPLGRQWVPETPEEWASLGPMEEGGFEDDDFAAMDRARENIAARRAAGLPPFEEDEGEDAEGGRTDP